MFSFITNEENILFQKTMYLNCNFKIKYNQKRVIFWYDKLFIIIIYT